MSDPTKRVFTIGEIRTGLAQMRARMVREQQERVQEYRALLADAAAKQGTPRAAVALKKEIN
jgi:hypothetical protein